MFSFKINVFLNVEKTKRKKKTNKGDQFKNDTNYTKLKTWKLG